MPLINRVGGGSGELQSKTVTPTTSQQTVKPDSSYDGLSQVTVNRIPTSYVQPSATKGTTTYTPGTSNQIISAGTYCSGTQTIKGDSNLVASNIKSGTSIFGVTGNYLGGKINSAYNVTLTQASDYTISFMIDTTNLLGVILFPDVSQPLTDTSRLAIATMFIDTIAKNGHFSDVFYTGGRWYIEHNEFSSGSVDVLLNGITFQPPMNLEGESYEILGTDWICIPIYKT